MWIYQSNALTERTAAPVQELPALTVQGNHPVPDSDTEPELSSQPVVLQRKQKRTEKTDLWLLAGSFLSGTAAAGVIRALSTGLQLDWLKTYLNLWLNVFTASGASSAALFAAGYFTLAGAATFFLLTGFSAFGPVVISLFLMFYGAGNGLLMLQLLCGTSLKEKLLVFLFTAFPSAVASACLCLLAAAATRMSRKIRAYSFQKSTSGQSWPDTGILVRRYIFTLVLLVPLCGAATGLACIEGRLF